MVETKVESAMRPRPFVRLLPLLIPLLLANGDVQPKPFWTLRDYMVCLVLIQIKVPLLLLADIGSLLYAVVNVFRPDWLIGGFKQTRRRRKRERHLKMKLRLSAILFQLFKVIMLEKRVVTILEFNWNQRLRHKRTKLNICDHMLTSSTQLQNRSFHVVERTRTSATCQKMKYALAKRAKILFFIVKDANLWGFSCRRRLGISSNFRLSRSDNLHRDSHKKSTALKEAGAGIFGFVVEAIS